MHVVGNTKEEDDEFFGKLAQAVFGRELSVTEVDGVQHVAVQGGLGVELKVGDRVQGILFNNGTVVAIGTADALKSHDHSGSVQDAIMDGSMFGWTVCAAVDVEGSTELYPADEVWPDFGAFGSTAISCSPGLENGWGGTFWTVPYFSLNSYLKFILSKSLSE